MKKLLLMVGVLMLLSSCQTEKEEEKAEVAHGKALCECVQGKDPNGNWDMHLSPECIQLCIATFGPELKGMEAWFKNNCGLDLKHPKVKDKKDEVNI